MNKKMKIFPEKKLMLIAYAIAFVLNIGEFARVDSTAKLIAWLLIDNVIYAILVVVALRIAIWIGKKAGLVK